CARGDRGTALFELLEVFFLIVGLAFLPAAPEDAQPFESKGAQDGMVSRSFSSLPLVIRFGPGTEDNGLAGPLDQSLAGKGRRIPAPMNPSPRAALFGDRCHTEVTLHG